MKFLTIIPSHKRPWQMETLFSVLGDCYVTVDDTQMEDYKDVVPPERLIQHPILHGMGAIRKWIADWCKDKCDCFAMLDDDVRHVDSCVHPKPYRYKTPENIIPLLENMGQILLDLDLPLGTFCGGTSIAMHYSNVLPFSLNKWAAQVYVINTSWLDRVNFSPEFPVAEDDDISLEAFLHSDARAIIRDNRFRFEFGQMCGNEGGLRSEESMNQWHDSHVRLKEKWKGYVTMESNDNGQYTGCKVKVPRKNREGKH